MIKDILHIGITVNNLDKSVNFYKNVLGLKLVGNIDMEGEDTDILFNKRGTKAKIAYLQGNDKIKTPLIELIELEGNNIEKLQASLFRTSISEICFCVDNIEKSYNYLMDKGVEFLSEPREFDFTKYGFGKSKAVYFKDIDGIILELIENIQDE